MSIEIKKNIPIPKGRSGSHGRPTKYPFGKMDIGDSFFIPKDSAGSASQCASIYKKKHGGNFTRRQVVGGFRIWRVE